jgi:radical SAM protein with 4Fe4S-binding SPASM domain
VNHNRVTANILDFLQARKARGSNGPIVETVMYSMPENAGEEKQFVDYWRGIVDHAREPVRISEQFAGKTGNGGRRLRTRICRDFWERMTVYWNGDVALCCEDLDGAHIQGNLKESSIREIWNGEKMRALKKLHRNRRFAELPLCAECDL